MLSHVAPNINPQVNNKDFGLCRKLQRTSADNVRKVSTCDKAPWKLFSAVAWWEEK
jgi:hypothetical protein